MKKVFIAGLALGSCVFRVAAQSPEASPAAVDPSKKNQAEKLLENAVNQVRSDEEFDGFRVLYGWHEDASLVQDDLAKLLKDPDANLRLGACMVLGSLKQLKQLPHLQAALEDPDWRVAFVACLAISRLDAKDAAPSLEALSKSHWYPRVRHAASFARHRILGEEPPDQDVWQTGADLFANRPDREFDVFDWYNRRSFPLDEASLKKLGVSGFEIEFVPWDIGAGRPAAMKTFKTLHPELHAAIQAGYEIAKSKEWSWYCRFKGLKTRDDTAFVALDGNEWGGGLFAIPKDEEATRILHANIHALMDWNGKLVALSGRDHMGMTRGAVHEVVKKQGKWTAQRLYSLPGCPFSGGLLPDGRLVANCQGGAVAIGKDGSFEYLGSGEKQPGE